MTTPRELHAFNETWIRLQRMAGVSNPDEFPFDLFGISVTTELVNWYVDAALGSDSGFGTLTSPFKTIQKAINSIPKKIRHPQIINIAAGTYEGFTINDFDVDYEDPAVGAFLLVKGVLINATLATGSATGTVTTAVQGNGTTNTYAVINDTTQSWTVNNLKGKFIEITGGTGVGQVYPIGANTATQVTVVASFITTVPDATSTYAIRDGGTVINTIVQRAGSAPTNTPTASACAYVSNNRTKSDSTLLLFQNLKFAPPSNAAVRAAGNSALSFQNCIVSTTGSTTGMGVQEGRFVALGCIFINPGTTGTYLSIGSQNQSFVTGTLLQNYFSGGGNGVLMNNAQISWTNQQFDNTQFPLVSGSNTYLMQCGTTKITGANTGITGRLDSPGGGNLVLQINNSFDISNTSTAIRLHGILCSITSVGTGFTGTGNTTAIQLDKGARLQFNAAATLTGTTEILLDGVSSTIATMRAASPKLLTNTYGTLIYE